MASTNTRPQTPPTTPPAYIWSQTDKVISLCAAEALAAEAINVDRRCDMKRWLDMGQPHSAVIASARNMSQALLSEAASCERVLYFARVCPLCVVCLGRHLCDREAIQGPTHNGTGPGRLLACRRRQGSACLTAGGICRQVEP